MVQDHQRHQYSEALITWARPMLKSFMCLEVMESLELGLGDNIRGLLTSSVPREGTKCRWPLVWAPAILALGQWASSGPCSQSGLGLKQSARIG